MTDFNGNAQHEDVVYVPAQDFLDVANVISRLVSAPNARDVGELTVAVRDGELHLGDESGSYGVRRFVQVERSTL